MGNLTSAVGSVEYERHVSEDVIATSASMQGYRVDMEDDHTISLRLPKHPQHAFIGVYDGHSGKASSEQLALQLWREVDKLEEITNDGISEILLQMDIDWSKCPERFSGSTVVFAIIERPIKNKKTYKITIGWVGDSRAFAVAKGKLKELTIDHKPMNLEERKRIELDGGSVSMDNRVDGELAMSRAFGDWNLKDPDRSKIEYVKNKVICIPEYQSIELEEGDCLLLSCDGLTEQLENKEIYDELLELQKKYPNDADVVLDGLLQKALYSGSKDNMTSVLVEFRQGAEFREREIPRLHTFRPGPLHESMKNNQFFEAYMKNVKSVGLWDCPALREAAYSRDLKVVEEESKACKDVAAKRHFFVMRKEHIEEGINEIASLKFESNVKPEVSSYSAFGDTEFVLKAKHEGYIAFLSDKEVVADNDEKKDEEEEDRKLDLFI